MSACSFICLQFAYLTSYLRRAGMIDDVREEHPQQQASTTSEAVDSPHFTPPQAGSDALTPVPKDAPVASDFGAAAAFSATADSLPKDLSDSTMPRAADPLRPTSPPRKYQFGDFTRNLVGIITESSSQVAAAARGLAETAAATPVVGGLSPVGSDGTTTGAASALPPPPRVNPFGDHRDVAGLGKNGGGGGSLAANPFGDFARSFLELTRAGGDTVVADQFKDFTRGLFGGNPAAGAIVAAPAFVAPVQAATPAASRTPADVASSPLPPRAFQFGDFTKSVTDRASKFGDIIREAVSTVLPVTDRAATASPVPAQVRPTSSTCKVYADLTPDLHLRYITLLCTYKPEAVLAYLMGSATYPLEATLSAVQAAGILEAVACLKEHTGDPKGALEVRGGVLLEIMLSYQNLKSCPSSSCSQVLCMCLDKKAAELKRLLDEAAAASLQPSAKFPSLEAASALLAEPSAAAATKIFTRALGAAMDLCSRTSAMYCSDAQSQQLWFSVLAWMVAQQQQDTRHPESDAGIAARTSFAADVSAAALRMTMSEALQSVVETMRRFIPLNLVLKKVLADHSQSLLGEFRGVILAMLGSHTHDARILAAGAMMKADLYTSVRRLHTGFATAINACNGGGSNGSAAVLPGADTGAGARSGITCASCGVVLLTGEIDASRSFKVTAASFSASGTAAHANAGAGGAYRVFGCGHSCHVGCVPHVGGAALHAGALRPTCPLCAKTADAQTPVRINSGVAALQSKSRPNDSSPHPSSGPGAFASSRNLQRPRLMQASEAGSDDDDALAARVGVGARGQSQGGSKGQVLGRDKLVPASRAAVDGLATSAEDADAGDPHITRLRQARAARAGSRPLTELFSEFRRSPGALQVRLRR